MSAIRGSHLPQSLSYSLLCSLSLDFPQDVSLQKHITSQKINATSVLPVYVPYSYLHTTLCLWRQSKTFPQAFCFPETTAEAILNPTVVLALTWLWKWLMKRKLWHQAQISSDFTWACQLHQVNIEKGAKKWCSFLWGLSGGLNGFKMTAYFVPAWKRSC